MYQVNAEILHQEKIAEKTYLIRLRCPEIASLIRPGQFIMIRIPTGSDPLLGRPFALYDLAFDLNGVLLGIDVVYLQVGKMTCLLPNLTVGKFVEVWGPLGKPFPIFPDVKKVTFVAGGIGQTPFLTFAKQLLGIHGYGGDAPRKMLDSVEMIYGVRNKSYFAGVSEFEKAGIQMALATDDGSKGFHGRVTQLLEQKPATDHWYGCGPEPMLKALGDLAHEKKVSCHVSLESPMACGLGICFSCVVKVKTGDGWDYRRICVDGPVFDSNCLVHD